MSNDYDYIQINAIATEMVSKYRGSPTEIAKQYAYAHLRAQSRYVELQAAEAREQKLISFLRRCFSLDVFREYPRLRDEALKLLDGGE